MMMMDVSVDVGVKKDRGGEGRGSVCEGVTNEINQCQGVGCERTRGYVKV